MSQIPASPPPSQSPAARTRSSLSQRLGNKHPLAATVTPPTLPKKRQVLSQHLSFAAAAAGSTAASHLSFAAPGLTAASSSDSPRQPSPSSSGARMFALLSPGMMEVPTEDDQAREGMSGKCDLMVRLESTRPSGSAKSESSKRKQVSFLQCDLKHSETRGFSRRPMRPLQAGPARVGVRPFQGGFSQASADTRTKRPTCPDFNYP